ncbi:MAG: sugar phosphate nucleotidyltransferase [archaeon]|jgi:mannose-1-phosphate guanylyltransferase
MIRALVLAGGSGKRLWPLSREKRPKQFLNIFVEHTFLEESVSRFYGLTNSVTISTSKALEAEVRASLPKNHLIVEPDKRDTAAALGLAAISFKPDDILVVTPADSFIDSIEKFQITMKKAIELAEKENTIVLVGAKPLEISDRYGYIEVEKGKHVKKIYKQPATKQVAKKYVQKGFFWITGIFVCKAQVLIDILQKHEPEIYKSLMKIKNSSSVDEFYFNIKKVNFHSVLDKVEHLNFVPASFYWNDAGAFHSMEQIIGGKNALMKGNLFELNSSGNIIHSTKNVALIDCHDLIVMDTPDTLLICPKKSAEKIKHLLEHKVPHHLR